ncbi:hypothetical protein ACTACK_10510 [Pseudomonas syringae]|uniref:hypothetical protein n=1 Tax=Pseudomonas syringae TaxID=317 RepID=UPI003F751181
MTDEQLILDAAKAAGISVQYSNNMGDFSNGEPYSKGEIRWNPLTDDADAFRLAVRLGLTVSPASGKGGNISEVYRSSPPQERIDKGRAELHGEDPMAATRRAIVRAAAALIEK